MFCYVLLVFCTPCAPINVHTIMSVRGYACQLVSGTVTIFWSQPTTVNIFPGPPGRRDSLWVSRVFGRITWHLCWVSGVMRYYGRDPASCIALVQDEYSTRNWRPLEVVLIAWKLRFTRCRTSETKAELESVRTILLSLEIRDPSGKKHTHMSRGPNQRTLQAWLLSRQAMNGKRSKLILYKAETRIQMLDL